MSFFNTLFQKDPLRDSVIFINDNIENIMPDHTDEKFNIIWYGDYHADPKSLVYWICVQTDKEKHALLADVGLNKKLRLLLDKYEYPEDARSSVRMGFESQEAVDRESNGSWDVHFKQ